MQPSEPTAVREGAESPAAHTPSGLPDCPFCGGELCAVVLGEPWNVPGVSCSGCGAYTSRLPMREPWLYEGRKVSGGDPDVVRPSDSRAESQAGLNGPGGSPTSPPERASAVTERRMIPPDAKRLDAVLIYRKCLLTHSPRWSGWKRLNEEIIERWSLSGLVYIKERAWNGS